MAWWQRPSVWLLVGLGALAACGLGHLIFWEATHPEIEPVHGYDDTRYWATAHSLWVDGDLDFENEFDRLVPDFAEPPTPIGRTANKYAVGMPMLAGPAVVAGRMAGLGGEEGFGRGLQILYLLWNMGLGLVGVGLIAATAARLVIPWAGVLGALTMFAGSTAIWYVLIQPSMAHAASLFAYALLFWGWERRYVAERPGLGWSLLMGVGVGLAAAIRMQDAPLGLLFVLSELRLVTQRQAEQRLAPRDYVLATLIFGIGGLVSVFPQLLYQRLLWGSWIINTYAAHEGEGFRWFAPDFGGLLFSTGNSLIFFHPLSALALSGLILAAWRTAWRGQAAVLLAVTFVNIYINAAWHAWWMGHSFGARGLLNCWPMLAVGLGYLIARAEDWKPGVRVTLMSLALVCLLWSSMMLLMYYTEAIPHDGTGFDLGSIPERLQAAAARVLGKLGLM